ncbi:fumarylacetoacetate hydrolase family protein [Pseudooctadecabacter jejudonensis]|uniref:Ureidoglycolate lyase n=1 Tax=Pseudooctadecabacter jejudonensis TaxID=1391910 RepID=A0A1Y5RA99_9RHOB|nr:fumarylacetoacetate hydrolase family protein [Pseudooctadecabacter jejudonensis]SLN10227.1 Ureidoglycolate lyase [Pseudooctadecabacter jejudonensis]
MKLIRFGPAGQEKQGVLDDAGTLRDLSGALDGTAAYLSDAYMAQIAALDLAALPAVPADTRVGACVTGVGNFIAIGLNYADHAAEAGMDIPAEPILFNKAPSCIVGPNDDVRIPPGSEKTDWEVELAVVIGKTGSYIAEADAMDHVAGFCVCNDVSEREYQLERGGTWTKGKGSPTFGPLGPWLVTRDEVDTADLAMTLSVNGDTVQNGSTSTMIFKVPHLVSYVSHFMELQAGDVITTGTPPGVGMGLKPQRYLKPGDEMVLEIAGLGVQRQTAVATP